MHEAYRQGQWYLPAEGELARLYWWHKREYELPETEPEYDTMRPVFAAGYNQVATNGGRLFNAFDSSWYWSSTEYSYLSSWGVYFLSGYAYGNYRGGNFAVRPVAAIEKSKI